MSAVEGRGLFFLDTNIFVCSFDPSSPQKQSAALALIHQALQTQRGVISTQVIQEFLNAGLRKFPQTLSTTEARTYLHAVLLPLCSHFPSAAFYERSILMQAETGYSWYDALIVSAALELGCSTLLSEDLQNGRVIRGMVIRNPFTSKA
jgi:predicted nucleic acid-binding protein